MFLALRIFTMSVKHGNMAVAKRNQIFQKLDRDGEVLVDSGTTTAKLVSSLTK